MVKAQPKPNAAQDTVPEAAMPIACPNAAGTRSLGQLAGFNAYAQRCPALICMGSTPARS